MHYNSKLLRLREKSLLETQPHPHQARKQTKLQQFVPQDPSPTESGGYHINPHCEPSFFLVVPSWIKSLLKTRGAKQQLLLLKKKKESLLEEFLLGSTNPDSPVVKSALSFVPLKQPVEYLISTCYSVRGKVHKLQHSLRVKDVSATTTDWQIFTEIVIP